MDEGAVVNHDLERGGGAAPKFLDQVRQQIRVRRYSRRTEDSYVDWVRRFVLFHRKRHPRDMGKPEIEAFLTHLAVERSGPCAATGRLRMDSIMASADVLPLP